MEVESYQESSVGAGSDTYFVSTKTRKYGLKFPSESEINNLELEPKPCNYLLIVWKLMRSYVYSAEECSNEKIDIDSLFSMSKLILVLLL